MHDSALFPSPRAYSPSFGPLLSSWRVFDSSVFDHLNSAGQVYKPWQPCHETTAIETRVSNVEPSNRTYDLEN
jgi:hypothetical protein